MLFRSPQTMSVIVSNLERSGAVSRRPHAVHGRIQHIEVTDAGRQLLAECRARVKAVEQELMAGIAKSDEQIVRRWLVQIALPAES